MELPFGRGDSPATSESSYDPMTVLMDEIDRPKLQPSQSKRRISDASISDEESTQKRARVALAGGAHDMSTSSRNVPVHDHLSRQLSPEIWHHIFTFLPPRSLGNLLRVNKLFHHYLHPSPTVSFPDNHLAFLSPQTSSGSSLVPVCKPETIWQASRRLFWPRMPAPLKRHTEMDMWRLVCSSRCQFCDTRESRAAEASSIKDQWHRGPGAKGVSPIFSFSAVCCSSCLKSRSLKEVEVLLSQTIPSPLLPGLPAVFLTSDMNLVAPQTLKADKSSAQDQLTKVYWVEQIDGIKGEFDAVKALGSAAAEEWLKGLEARGKSALADVARWEKWELQGGLRQARLADVQPRGGSGTTTPTRPEASTRLAQTRIDGLMTAKTGPHKAAVNPLATVVLKNGPNGIQWHPQAQQQKRTAEEVADLKQKRKSEIERRAGLLEPPLTPAVLAHMPSFQAALQIPAPLDQFAWKLLEPRLLAQQADAEKRERESRVVTGATEDNQTTSDAPAGPRRDPREVPDKEWDDIQGPVRLKISNYADEIIKDGWAGGSKLTKKNVCQFVAEVLVYVRKRFYAEVAKDAAAAVAAGKSPMVDPPEGPWTQKLTLENMKWVFDAKVRARAEKHRKDLFFCNGCPTHVKPYGFEGVLQHYAAKHTDSLSISNVVLFWRAEWPEEPPFRPDPKQPPKQLKSKAAPVAPQASCPSPAPASFQSPGPDEVAAPVPTQPASARIAAPVPVKGTAPGLKPLRIIPDADTSRQPSPEYLNQLSFMTDVARQTWDRVKKNDSLHQAIKVCTVIHHIAKTFQAKFSKAAPLEMFRDGLKKAKVMRPMSKTNGLHCKICNEDLGASETKYCLANLAKHFTETHVDNQERPWDWRTHMVALPGLEALQCLPARLTHDKVAYDAVEDALPWAFNGQLEERVEIAPSIVSGSLSGNGFVPYQRAASRAMSRAAAYHPYDQARVHNHPHWPQPPQADPSQTQYHPPPTAQVKPEYEYSYREGPPATPVEEYELLEVRDPQHGTYYIRCPIRRESFTYEPRGEIRGHEQQQQSFAYDLREMRGHDQPHPVYNEDTQRLAAPPPPTARAAGTEEYDPRFPAGNVSRY